jgi:hypothetical protein
MHHCLEVDEVLRMILQCLHDSGDLGSVASIAVTCRAFHESATDVLWKSVRFEHLVMTLPEDLWYLQFPLEDSDDEQETGSVDTKPPGDEDMAFHDEDGASDDEDEASVDEDEASVDEDEASVDEDEASVDEDEASVDEDEASVDEDVASVDEDGASDSDYTEFSDYDSDSYRKAKNRPTIVRGSANSIISLFLTMF